MITLELANVEIDHCTDCGGIWLDAGELEQLLGDNIKVKRLLDSFKVDSTKFEKLRQCPICDRKMQKIIVDSGQPAMLIDKCRIGDGLWFDKGELHNIIEKAQFDKNNKVLKLLADMFGQNQQNQG
ncbi:MAG: hypothetical protein A2173_04600 [Planctomycetes bacterium RBG_13_44_8b]|nr:MAG: hypothetical protein A2173_04600 [Planctomycetes bacterium RBG_13_44_8b]